VDSANRKLQPSPIGTSLRFLSGWFRHLAILHANFAIWHANIAILHANDLNVRI